MNKIKAIIRLIFVTNLYFINGLGMILFFDKEVIGFNHIIEDFKAHKELRGFVDNLEDEFDKVSYTHDKEEEE